MKEHTHVIDWDKVKTLEDVINILRGLEIKIDPDKVKNILVEYSKYEGINSISRE